MEYRQKDGSFSRFPSLIDTLNDSLMKEPILNWLIRALSSSLGKKYVMGITGLLLCGFLIAHLAGNLLLFVGAEEYNHYAHALHEQKALLAVAEVGLFVLFVAHLILAFVTTRENKSARKQDYDVQQSKQGSPLLTFFPHNWMWITGVVVLGFILLHLADFRLEFRNKGPEGEEPFEKAVRLLRDPITFCAYITGVIVLGFHLSHGFSSAFQSLGLSHPKYNKFIKCAGTSFAVLVAVGFASFPLWAVLFQ
jgi:succinate dehydrogenase / fumarate reductase cytochrome b subunit